MIKSMTGYGRGEFNKDNIAFSVDIRSVNHRYSDISIRMPKIVWTLEQKVRDYISEKISRGKIDVYINYDSFGQDVQVKIDNNLVGMYIESLNSIRQQFEIKDEITLPVLVRLPELFKLEKVEQDEDSMWLILKEALAASVSSLLEMREKEGERLYFDLIEKINRIEQMVETVKDAAETVVDEYRIKLHDRIKELAKDIVLDENRLITEVAIFAEKSSIDEELVRLSSHINQFKNTINMNGSVGKKLDFIVQEMNREINTIGSKASNVNIINNVIAMKTELEKVREQIQNIE